MPDLLAALDAFMQEHRRCGELDGGVERELVWMACDCGASVTQPRHSPESSPRRLMLKVKQKDYRVVERGASAPSRPSG